MNSRSCVVSDLLKQRSKDQSIGVLYFYCDGNYAAKNETRNILGSLLRQLVQQSDQSRHHELEGYLAKLRMDHDETPQQVLLSLFASSIERLSTEFRSLFIAVDGIDECAKRADLLRFLKALASEKRLVLVASRPEADIKFAFADELQLNVSEEMVQGDIETYIHWRLSREPGLLGIKPDMKREISETLARESAGM
jgi:hypothetical protein